MERLVKMTAAHCSMGEMLRSVQPFYLLSELFLFSLLWQMAFVKQQAALPLSKPLKMTYLKP